MKRLLGVILAGAVAIVASTLAQSKPAPRPAASKEWPTYGHDPGGMRFSPLTQITPANVGQLKVAWVYHMRPRPAVPAANRPAGAGASSRAGAGGRGRGSGFARARPRRSSSTA